MNTILKKKTMTEIIISIIQPNQKCIKRPVLLAENVPSLITNSLRNFINSLTIRKVSHFTEKSPKNSKGKWIFFGVEKCENEGKSL